MGKRKDNMPLENMPLLHPIRICCCFPKISISRYVERERTMYYIWCFIERFIRQR